MNKAELITWIATLPDDSPDLGRVDAIRRGAGQAGPEEPPYTPAEIAREVRKHSTWLHKLEVQKHCGVKLAGRFMYRKKALLSFLMSEACQKRIAELRAQRRAHERAKNGGTP
jgi:hypothetical protein